jgi:hypothetical protein
MSLTSVIERPQSAPFAKCKPMFTTIQNNGQNYSFSVSVFYHSVFKMCDDTCFVSMADKSVHIYPLTLRWAKNRFWNFEKECL